MILTLVGDRRPVNEAVAEFRPKDVLVLVGPEGDFTPQETGLARSKGFTPVSLGDTVLRVTTAAIAAASYLRFALDG
jgi:16S rRNA (uracil1498-N3)-methyltransferase